MTTTPADTLLSLIAVEVASMCPHTARALLDAAEGMLRQQLAQIQAGLAREEELQVLADLATAEADVLRETVACLRAERVHPRLSRN